MMSAEQFKAAYEQAAPRTLELSAYGAERFVGDAPPVKWLVQGTIPLGVPALLAAMGDTGKSYLALQAGFRVAIPPPRPTGNLNFNTENRILGGEIVAHGTAVFITAEDDEAEVHRRLQVIDPFGRRFGHPGKLIVIALPSAGGPMPFFVSTPNGVVETPEWRMICDQLVGFNDLKLACFDPLANFAQVSLDADSSAVQHVMGQFGKLASETGGTMLLPHHMRKSAKAPQSVQEAREQIKGVSQLVDGARLAYALWPVEEADGKKVCKDLQVPFRYNRVVNGAVVKANGSASREIATYVRTDDGLLIDRTGALQAIRPAWDAFQDAMVDAIAAAAAGGLPFTKTGKAGLYEQRERLPESLRSLSKNKLEKLCQELIEARRVLQCKAAGSNAAQWLDVPGDRFATGEGDFKPGAQVVPFPGGGRS